MPILASCPNCSKSYRVPHADKEWQCKVCDESLVLAEEASAEPKATECTSCGALFFGGETYCDECGERLGQSKESLAQDKRQAAADMRRAMKRVSRLKSWITYNLVVSVFVALVLIPLALLSDLTGIIKVLVIGFQVVSVGLAIFCRVHFDRRPFPILVTLASMQTLSAILAFLGDTRWEVSVGWAAGLWIMSADAAQVARLARQFPDLYLSKRLRGEHLSHSGKSGRKESRAQRLIRQDRQRAVRKRWVRIGIASGVLLLSIIAFVGYKVVTAPPGPENAIANFRSAWNAEDVDSVLETATLERRDRLGRSLGVLARRLEWGDKLPKLESSTWNSKTPDKARVRYLGEAGTVIVLFEYKNERWGFVGIDLRGVEDWRPAE